MKYVLVFMLACLCLAQVYCELKTTEEWEDFKKKFDKKYSSEEDEESHYKTFLKNKELIEEHNKKYEKKEVSFTMELNHFSDMTPDDLKKLFANN